MSSIKSNNPYRNSFHAEDSNSPNLSLPPSSYPLSKTPSTTTTIVEEEEDEQTSEQRNTATPMGSSPPTPPPAATTPEPRIPPPAFVVAEDKKSPAAADGNGHILITIHPTDSNASTPPHTGTSYPTHRMSVDASQANKDCNMWPARRFMQKARAKSKRRWIALKVIVALVIIIGAVAVGLGINKAVRDARASGDAM